MPNTADFAKNLKTINNIFTETGNVSAEELASMQYIKLTIDTLKNGKHPILNKFNFAETGTALPNSTLLDKTTGNYVGSIFGGNTGMALELFSLGKHKNMAFVPLEQVKRLKLYHLVKPEDIINVILQDKYTDKKMSNYKDFNNKTSEKFINIESLLKSGKKPFGLTEKQLSEYFPEFDKQSLKHKEYIKKNKINYYNNFNDKDPKKHQEKQKYLKSVKEEIKFKNETSILPKLTKELSNYRFCQLTGLEYKPTFSQSEHLEDIIKLIEENKGSPVKVSDAIKNAGYIMQYSLNKLFTEDSSVRAKNIIKEKDIQNTPPEKKKERTLNQNKTLSRGMSRGM